MDMVTMEKIKEVGERIGRAAYAERVLLFGSHASGRAGEFSDVDFLVVAENDLPRFKRSRELYRLFKPYPFAMDIVVYTPDEVRKGKRSPASFISNVLKEGKVIYERRPGSRAAMAGESRQ